jgi:hypothetical protein
LRTYQRKFLRFVSFCEEGEKMPAPILKYFTHAHLPSDLQEVSKPISDLASLLDLVLPDGPEKSAGLRKLLEAKDCFVRARLDARG